MHIPTLRSAVLARWALPFFLCLGAQAQTSSPLASWSTFAGPGDGPTAQAPLGTARLVLMRQADTPGANFPADILVDGRFLTSLLPGGFAEVEVCPGSRQLELAGQGTSGLSVRPRHTLEVAPGRSTYVLVQGPNSDTPLRSDLSTAQADTLLQGLRRQTHAVSRVPPALNCAPPPAAQAPAVVAQALPVPAPAAPASPPLAPPRKFTLSAEMLFAFGGSKPQHLAERGRQEITALARQLKTELKPSDHVIVQGHTDPMGNDTLNQRLSTERADTVRSILVSQGLPAKQVSAEGMGSKRLLVSDCSKRHAKRDDRIFCDLPNRRVEITVAPLKN